MSVFLLVDSKHERDIFEHMMLGKQARYTESFYQRMYQEWKAKIKEEESEYSSLKFVLVSEDEKNQKRNMFVYEDQHKKKWLFKEAEEHEITSAVLGYRLFAFFNCPTPQTHKCELRIGGVKKNGYMQEFIENAKALSFDDIVLCSTEQINYMLRQEILDWLFISSDTDFISWRTPSGKLMIIGVDKDETLFNAPWVGPYCLPKHYGYLWSQSILGNIMPDMDAYKNSIELVVNTPNEILTEIITPFLENFLSYKAYAVVQDGHRVFIQDKKSFYKWLFKRKARVVPFFKKRLRSIEQTKYFVCSEML